MEPSVAARVLTAACLALNFLHVPASTCPVNNRLTLCSCAEAALFQDVGVIAGIPGRYYMSHPLLTNLEAQYACQKINGYLLEVDNQDELTLIRDAIDPLLMNSIEIHIGGTVSPGSSTILSVARPGQLLVDDWHTGQPTAQASPSCVTFYRRPRNRGLKMGSIACDTGARRFICEI